LYSFPGVPDSWTPDQIKNFQDYWDAYFTGDLAARRRAKFVPGGVAKTFIQTKEPELKPELNSKRRNGPCNALILLIWGSDFSKTWCHVCMLFRLVHG
jgi:hypothetical protein